MKRSVSLGCHNKYIYERRENISLTQNKVLEIEF